MARAAAGTRRGRVCEPARARARYDEESGRGAPAAGGSPPDVLWPLPGATVGQCLLASAGARDGRARSPPALPVSADTDIRLSAPRLALRCPVAALSEHADHRRLLSRRRTRCADKLQSVCRPSPRLAALRSPATSTEPVRPSAARLRTATASLPAQPAGVCPSTTSSANVLLVVPRPALRRSLLRPSAAWARAATPSVRPASAAAVRCSPSSSRRSQLRLRPPAKRIRSVRPAALMRYIAVM